MLKISMEMQEFIFSFKIIKILYIVVYFAI